MMYLHASTFWRQIDINDKYIVFSKACIYQNITQKVDPQFKQKEKYSSKSPDYISGPHLSPSIPISILNYDIDIDTSIEYSSKSTDYISGPHLSPSIPEHRQWNQIQYC